jgi:hypothetical protein
MLCFARSSLHAKSNGCAAVVSAGPTLKEPGPLSVHLECTASSEKGYPNQVVRKGKYWRSLRSCDSLGTLKQVHGQ